MREKRCSKCGELKSLDDFSKDKQKKDGRSSRCKQCINDDHRASYPLKAAKVSEAGRRYYRENREQVLERCRNYREVNREKVREAARTHYKANKERLKEEHRLYRQRNKEKVREYNHRRHLDYADAEREYRRKYYQANKEKIRKRHLAYRAANAEKVRERRHAHYINNLQRVQEQNRAYHKAHPHVRRAAKQRRQAIMRQIEGSYAATDINYLYEIQNGCCAYCSKPLNGSYHIDHVIPLSRGGTNWPTNLALACEACNLSKHDKLLYSEWQPPNPLSLENNSTAALGPQQLELQLTWGDEDEPS